MNQRTLFDLEEKKRTRAQIGYKRSASKNGSLSIHIDRDLACRVREYCQRENRNCKKVVMEWIEKGLANAEADMLKNLSENEAVIWMMNMSDEERNRIFKRLQEKEK